MIIFYVSGLSGLSGLFWSEKQKKQKKQIKAKPPRSKIESDLPADMLPYLQSKKSKNFCS